MFVTCGFPPMLRFTLRKAIQGVLMLVFVSGLTFYLLSAAGGDALSALRDNPQINVATLEQYEKLYGLDERFITRYTKWVGNAVVGDLGRSFAFQVPVSSLIWSRFLNTALISGLALIIAMTVSLTLAIANARFRSRLLNGFVDTVVLVAASTPRMVLALAALAVIVRASSVTAFSGSSFVSLFVGAAVLSTPLIALLLAQLRRGIEGAMNEDFIRVARAKGLSEWIVVIKHALRPGLDPALAIAGVSLGALFGGSVIVETILAWPGIGALMVQAVKGRDIPLVMGVVVASSAAVWLGNAIAEYLQLANDARLRT
jgi:peptide/nickel transport system permease protein